jgi:hypothetical protein
MEMSSQSGLKPDFHQFVPVLIGWVRQMGDAERAERVLLWWAEVSQDPSRRAGRIMPAIYEMVVNEWLRSDNLPRATELIFKIKKLFGARYIDRGPDLITHESLLRAWRRSDHKDKGDYIAKLEETVTEFQENMTKKHLEGVE